MFNIIVSTIRAVSIAFGQMFAFFSINGVRVLNILLMGYQLQVIQTVVGAVKVFMVYFQSPFNWPVKRFPHNAVNRAASIFAVFAQGYLRVTLKQRRFANAVRNITRPSLTVLYGHNRRNASIQKRSYRFQSAFSFQHLFGLSDLICGKQFSSRGATYVSVIAYFVQIFKPKHWLPRFHMSAPFNMYRSIS
jgi:hypothetical protein